MSKFLIQSHGRLQEWVAEEKGYFKEEGLDYEFIVKQIATWSGHVQSTESAPIEMHAGAYESQSAIIREAISLRSRDSRRFYRETRSVSAFADCCSTALPSWSIGKRKRQICSARRYTSRNSSGFAKLSIRLS